MFPFKLLSQENIVVFTIIKRVLSLPLLIKHATLEIKGNLPSKQKLELKSSKTRLLHSRSGVLIEFQSGVFTGNSRVISGLKLEFSPS